MTGWSQDDAKDDKKIPRWDGNPASFLNWLDDVKWFTHRVDTNKNFRFGSTFG